MRGMCGSTFEGGAARLASASRVSSLGPRLTVGRPTIHRTDSLLAAPTPAGRVGNDPLTVPGFRPQWPLADQLSLVLTGLHRTSRPCFSETVHEIISCTVSTSADR